MPTIFFAQQVDGVRSFQQRATADATPDAAQVAAKTEVDRAQAPLIQIIALVRVEGGSNNTQWSLRSLTLDASCMRAPRRVLTSQVYTTLQSIQ